MPHDRVFIVGDCPSWVQGVTHIPFTFGKSKVLNEWRQLFAACKHTDHFLLFNDDFYILNTLKATCFAKDDIKPRRSNYYKTYLRTKALFDGFVNYEVHAPMLFKSDKFLKLENEYDIQRGYLHRSVYGNHYGVPALLVQDNKVYSRLKLHKAFGQDFLSTTDTVEKSKEFKNMIHKRFESKSKYENNGVH